MVGPRFGLFGVWGAYNYGVESIIRGVEVALRGRWPECTILYVSPSPAADRQRLRGCDLEIVRRTIAPRASGRWLANALLRRLSLGRMLPREDMEWVTRVDAVISIGGDLYTLPPAPLLAPGRPFRHTHLLDLGDWILGQGKALVLWGASIGPFEAWPAAREAFARHLPHASLILAREPGTIEYLASLGIRDNVRAIADPAFLPQPVPYELRRQRPELPLIGVNLSPLSAQYRLHDRSMELVIEEQAAALVRLADSLDVELLLLPHVISDSRREDDDRGYLIKIHERIAPHIGDRVGIVLDDPGAQQMKSILATCDAVMASRMHCAVHAASVGTPALFLAYSAKARGMSRYVYGDDAFCLPLEDLSQEGATARIAALVEQRSVIAAHLGQQRPRFDREARAAAAYIDAVLMAMPGCHTGSSSSPVG